MKGYEGGSRGEGIGGSVMERDRERVRSWRS